MVIRGVFIQSVGTGLLGVKICFFAYVFCKEQLLQVFFGSKQKVDEVLERFFVTQEVFMAEKSSVRGYELCILTDCLLALIGMCRMVSTYIYEKENIKI